MHTYIKSLNLNDEKITDETKIAEALNNYFTRVGPDLANQIPKTNIEPDAYMKSVETNFTFKTMSVNQVFGSLNKIKTSKSLGPDKIPARLLKDSSIVIAPYLTHIFNLSLTTGTFPHDWKEARVSPIHKSGDKTECGNYRPISVLSVVSKLFEKLVYTQLNNYLTENSILTIHQSGFREGHSTATSMLTTTNSWLINMDSGLINGIIFLDLCKAFDTIDHGILIRKLYLYGIRGSALKWFTSYLEHRSQICKVNSVTSSPKPIQCGVPQGSNLGPLLFLLYINDLPNCLDKSVPAMYADDTNITISGETIKELEDQLNSELNNIHNWLLVNKLTINVGKTEYMIIGTRQRLLRNLQDPKIQIGGTDLKRVSVTKSLGILVDENLDWNEQIDNISKKVSKGIGILRRVKPYISGQSLQIIYQSLILPHFDYCSNVWGNCNQMLKNKLQRLQNRAARVITGDTYDVRSYEILDELGWETLEKRREEQTASYVTKVLNGKCPQNISSMFEISNNTNYNLRSNNNMLMLSKPKTNAMKRSFGYAAAKIWNKLPKLTRGSILEQSN